MKFLALRRFNVIDALGLTLFARYCATDRVWTGISLLVLFTIISCWVEIKTETDI